MAISRRALRAHYLTFIAPASFGFMFSVQLIVMVVLGGMVMRARITPGAFFVTILPEFLRCFSENIEILLFGAILVLCMMFYAEWSGGWLEQTLVCSEGTEGS